MNTLRSTVSDSCLRRITTWRTPPNWSRREWVEEMRSVVDSAAIQAESLYNSSYGCTVTEFLYGRILAAALTRHRQEWAFGCRCAPLAETQNLTASVNLPDGFRFASPPAVEEAIADLPAESRTLVRLLFWDKETEADIASMLGVSQQAVSKRKRTILRRLNQRLRHTAD